MATPSIFSHSFLLVRQQWRVAAIVYFVQWSLALTLGMQVYSVLESSIGNSLEINKLLSNYDHTVLTDFLKVHGASITPLIGQLRWLLLVWLVFSVFIHAGLIFCVSQGASSTPRDFWVGGARYFFPFLRISLIFLALALMWTALIWLPVGLFLEPSLQYFPSEAYSVWVVLLLLAVYLLGLAGLFVWSIASRFAYLRRGTWRAGMSRQKWASAFRWALVFMGLQGLFVALYWLLDALIGMGSPLSILLMFGVQQTFAFLRIQMRQMMYATIGQISDPVGNHA